MPRKEEGRVYTKDAKTGPAILNGWVQQVRDIGNLKFFILRDREGVIQVTAKKGVVSEKIIEQVGKLTREDAVSVKGKVVNSRPAPGGLEVIPDSIEVLAHAETPLPIDMGKSEKSKRFDYRFLDLRDEKASAIFKLKSLMVEKVREFYLKEGFVETHTPSIQAAGAEGGASLFPVIYYNKEAFLRQSPQLYKQMLMSSGLDKVFEIGPAFRAEEFHTRRHVSEFLSVDAEMSWIESEEDVLKHVEGLVAHVLEGVQKSPLLKKFESRTSTPRLPFKRLTYDEAVGMLKGEVKWGEDLGENEERKLGELLAKKGVEWYFITKYPSQIKPFYIMMEGKYSRGIDLCFRGMEIASGGQREHRYGEVLKNMKSKGMDPQKFTFFTDALKFGCPPHGGYGLGLERLLMQLLNLSDVKETILFPRTPERLVP